MMKNPKNKKIIVNCDFEISEKCKKKYIITQNNAKITRKNNDNKIICLYCSRTMKFSGNGNPNNKYTINGNYLDTIDIEEKAYFLGLIAADGHIRKNTVEIVLNGCDKDILEKLKNLISKDLPVKKIKKTLSCLTINSKQFAIGALKGLNLKNGGKKFDIIRLPKLKNDLLIWCYIRGHFDGDGYLVQPIEKKYPCCSISSMSKEFLNDIKNFSNIKCSINEKEIIFYGKSCIEFLNKIYDNSNIHLMRKYDKYVFWKNWQPNYTTRIKSLNGLKNVN